MKKILSLFITAQLILTPSYLQAGLDSWISSVLPQSMRASQHVRDECYKAKKIMGIKRPVVITKNDLGETTLGSTCNNGPFSHVKIDEKKDGHQSDSHELLHTIYHEMGHVKHNHSAEILAPYTYNALAGAALFVYAVITKSKLAQAGVVLSSFLAGRGIDAPLYSKEENQQHELEADAAAAQAMAQAGHCELLEQKLKESKIVKKYLFKIDGIDESIQQELKNESGNYRTRGELYPTLDQEIDMYRAAFRMCEKSASKN